MLKTIIKKEILEALVSHRFLIATLLLLVLIPVGMYVNLKDYEQRLADYQESIRLYQPKAKERVHPDYEAQGFRPPSVLSVFSVGLEYFLPNKVVTSPTGTVRTSNESGIGNPESLLFGKVDLLFNVSFVISLLAMIFTFSMITGEKEDGTLRLLVSNPVPRWKILLAKIVGNYLVLLIPFLLSLLIALVILNVSGIVLVLSMKLLPSFLVTLFVTLLFVLSMFNLGMLVSTLTHRSITSIVTLLFLWTILVLSWPKISPMIAKILYPVESEQVHRLEKSLARADIIRERDKKRRELYVKILKDFGIAKGWIKYYEEKTETERKALAAYDEARTVLDQEYERRIAAEIRKLDQDYENRRNRQSSIARGLSRLSPVSSYTFIVTEIAGTGVLELQNFLAHARRFQQEIKEQIYDKFIIKWYGTPGGYTSIQYDVASGFNPRQATIPRFSYSSSALSDALQAEWVDILLLLLFNVIFFAAGYVSFLKYDVR
jgi:ABC-2 type transport system permease protein